MAAISAHAPGLGIQGDRTSGADVRSQNVTAVAAVANIVKSSLGPVGLDKAGRDGDGDGVAGWGGAPG